MNSDTLAMPSDISTNIELIDDIRKLKDKIKTKKHDLDRTKSELSLGDKDERYRLMLLEQKARSEENSSSKLEELEEKYEREREKILAMLEDCEKKFELKKKKLEAEANEKAKYFTGEIKRLETTRTTNPKTRALEFDITDLYKQLSIAETKLCGQPLTVSDVDLGSSEQQEIQEVIQNETIKRETLEKEEKKRIQQEEQMKQKRQHDVELIESQRRKLADAYDFIEDQGGIFDYLDKSRGYIAPIPPPSEEVKSKKKSPKYIRV